MQSSYESPAPDVGAVHELGAVVDDLVRARVELAAATQEAEQAGEELRRRTAEIEELNDLLEGSLAAVDDVIVVVGAATRRVRGWSGGAVRRLGLPADEAVGRSLSAIHRQDLPAGRLAEAVTRLARPTPKGIVAERAATLEAGADRFELTAVPPDPDRPVRAVVVRVVRAGPASDVDASAEPADDAGEPA